MIPNPFQVRPTYNPSKDEGDGEPKGGDRALQKVYKLVSSVTTGKNYVIVNRNSAGSGNAIGNNNSNTATNYSVTVTTGDPGDGNSITYISEPNNYAVWTSTVSGTSYSFVNNSRYLGHNNQNALTMSTTQSNWNGGSMNLYYNGNRTRYLRYNNGWSISTTSSNVYFYEETLINVGGAGIIDDCNTETFNDQTASAYNVDNGSLPDGWTASYTSNAYNPHVSNNSYYGYITNYDGNYLLMSACNGSNYHAEAITPQYDNISSISFRYRFNSSSYGRLQLGYYNGSTFTTLRTINQTTSWTETSLTASEIANINNHGGQLVFRFYSNRSNNTTYYSVAIDNFQVCIALPTYNVNINSGITGVQ